MKTSGMIGFRPCSGLASAILMSACRFAITYTVKNEARLLSKAVQYHLKAGCSRFYIFWDGTTDSSRELVSGLDHVVSRESVTPDTMGPVPDWIRELAPRWSEHIDVRKRLNTFEAARLASAEGIDWLLCIDPDELLLPDPVKQLSSTTVANYLDEIPASVDQVLLRNLEVVPTRAFSEDPFVECKLFLNRFPVTESVWRYSRAGLRKFIKNPKKQAWYDYLFYRARFMGALPRLMRHPISQEAIPASYFLGYSNHKAFVRSRAALDFNFNIHWWKKANCRPKTSVKGYVLHYDLFDCRYMLNKFKQRQPLVTPKVFFTRHMIDRICQELSCEEARRFFEENICIRDKSVIEELLYRRILVNIDTVSRFIRDQ